MFRNSKQMVWCVVAVVAGLACVSQVLAKKPAKPDEGGDYTLVLLPDSQGDTSSNGYVAGMNEVVIDGQLEAVELVGSIADNAYHWLLDAQGNVVLATPLALPGQVAEAHDINDDGIVAGGKYIDGVMLPLVWLSLEDEPTELPVPNGVTGTAIKVNNCGMVLGLLEDAVNLTEMLVVWQLTEGGTGPTAGPLILSETSTIGPSPDLNDAGQVVARVRVGGTYRGQRWSVSWNDGLLTASGPETLMGIITDDAGQPKTVSLKPQAINELGDICGEYGAVDGPFGAFLLLADDTLIDLPPLDSKRYFARSGNTYDLTDAVDTAAIQIVGYVDFFDKRSGREAGMAQVVWQGGNAIDLEAETSQPVSDLRLVGIDRISNHGWLAGYAGDNTAPRAAVIVSK
jgi:hypothetical protein